MKPGATLVLGETDPELVPIFLARDPERGRRCATSTSVCAPTRSRSVDGSLDLFTPYASYDDVFLPLHGAHQADNAALALTAAESLPRPRARSDDSSPTRSRPCSTPGRLEVVGHHPLVVIDGMKNVAGARAVRAALAEEFAESPRTLVIGVLREKDPHEMLDALGVARRRAASCAAVPRSRAATTPTRSPTRRATSASTAVRRRRSTTCTTR